MYVYYYPLLYLLLPIVVPFAGFVTGARNLQADKAKVACEGAGVTRNRQLRVCWHLVQVCGRAVALLRFLYRHLSRFQTHNRQYTHTYA